MEPKMSHLLAAALTAVLVLAALPVSAGDTAGGEPSAPVLTVLPWNGAQAAVSLTFDDGDPSQWETAIPALNQRHLKATFFLIACNIANKPVWIRAYRAGHEVGNHSMTHGHPADYTPAQVETETTGAQQKLQADLGADVVTFAYPYREITPAMEESIRRTHIAARGGWRPSYYMKPGDDPDWYDIPSQLTLTDTPLATYVDWIDDALSERAWTVFMIHAIEGAPWGYQPMPKATFYGLLDRLQDNRMWVAPFGTVCAYWQAQKIVEKASPGWDGRAWNYAWTVPGGFPKGVTLKVRLAEPRVGGIRQAGKAIVPDAAGDYVISFDAARLAVQP
jgi:peptidoglycan/xylan/chitin deacetylase (PgdA/CDA1 family)